MSIKQRITIGFGALVASLLLLFSLFIYQTYESYRQSLMRSRLQRRAVAGQLYFQNRNEFHRSTYLTLPDQHETILGPDNRIIYKSSGPDDHKLTTGLLAEAREKEVYFKYDGRPWNAAKEGVALSFKVDGVTYVSVVTAYDLAGRQASNSLLFILFVGNIMLLVIVAFAGFWFARRSMHPFDQLIEQMNPASVNDFSFRLQSTSRADEAAYLANSFNELLLRTVLINILDNASKYSGKSPVKLDVDLADQHQVITITDQGMGIPAEQLGEIFMPMMRANNVGKVPGFGLGLTIAKKIIDIHQGTLTVRSQPRETSVAIELPTKSLDQ